MFWESGADNKILQIVVKTFYIWVWWKFWDDVKSYGFFALGLEVGREGDTS